MNSDLDITRLSPEEREKFWSGRQKVVRSYEVQVRTSAIIEVLRRAHAGEKVEKVRFPMTISEWNPKNENRWSNII